MAQLNDDSIFFELEPELPTVPETNIVPEPANLDSDRYYYLLSSPNLLDYANAWQYLINATNSPIAKWLEIGQPTYYEDFPFSLSILSSVNVLEKNEKVLRGDKTQISLTDYDLLESGNVLLRIALEGQYSNDAKFIDVALQKSTLNINHFASPINFNGFIEDVNGYQDGQLIDSNCLVVFDFANAKIRLPEIIEIEPSTLNKNENATASITTSGNNEITFNSSGLLYDLTFSDKIGNTYEFPLCERYLNQDSQFSYLLHGISRNIVDGTKRHVYAWFDGGSFAQQDFYHWMPVFGADLNTNQADTSQKIWYPKDREKERMYTLGPDDDYYVPDLIPVV